MLQRIDVVNVQIPCAVADDEVLPDGLIEISFGEFGRRPQRHHVGLQRPRRVVEHVAHVEVEVLDVGDDRGADVHVGAQAAGVIEVLMRVDEPADRFPRDKLDDLFDHRKAALSLSGASNTAMKSRNSTAMLLWVPPPSR